MGGRTSASLCSLAVTRPSSSLSERRLCLQRHQVEATRRAVDVEAHDVAWASRSALRPETLRTFPHRARLSTRGRSSRVPVEECVVDRDAVVKPDGLQRAGELAEADIEHACWLELDSPTCLRPRNTSKVRHAQNELLFKLPKGSRPAKFAKGLPLGYRRE